MERILRWWSPFGVSEVACAIAPWWLAGLVAYAVWRAPWLPLWVNAGLWYLLSAATLSFLAGWWSRRRLGLRRYIVVPIPRWVALCLMRGKMVLPKRMRYFLLHVRVERGLDPRRMSQEMREDVERAMQAEWTKDAVFLGCTFGSLGALQKKLLRQYGEVEMVEGTFLPGQTWLLRPAQYQKKMFGNVWSRNTNWRMVRFQKSC